MGRHRHLPLGRLALGFLLSLVPGASGAEERIAELLRRHVEALVADHSGPVGEDVVAVRALPRFYEDRLYRPGWVEQGRPSRRAAELRRWIQGSGRHGLDPEDYHATTLDRLAGRAATGADAALLAELDLLHTDAFLLLGAHLVNGRLHPETFDPEWIAVRREVDLVALVERAIAGDAVAEALGSLLPRQPGYGSLVDGLERHRRWAARGGWPAVPDGPGLELGDSGARVAALRLRLERTEELARASAPETFDQELDATTRSFQRRHGLAPDGRVGPRTLEALNVDAATRARQIELNLERWRWLPRDLGERYVLVNVPGFSLDVVEHAATVLSMRVIVGRPYRRTPVFSDLMRYLVFNPYWEVPPSIAVQDKLPLIRKDPSYLEAQGFRVYSGWGAEEQPVDPSTVDWSSLGRGAFPYRLRQDPGPLNALGRVKFMFPNAFNVYLHDTPSRELFASAERDVSSGCIRLEQPIDLAEYVLRDDPSWTRDAIEAAVTSGRTRTVPLPSAIAVHLQYWTAWAQDDGRIAFRRDIYGRDARLDGALRDRRPPPPVP